MQSTHTVEPPYKGHLGTRHLILYREVVVSLEVQKVLSRYGVHHLGPFNLSFIRRLFQSCPLYRVSIKRGSNVHVYHYYCIINNCHNLSYNRLLHQTMKDTCIQISPAVSVQHTVELSVISQLKQDNQRLAIELAGTVQYNQCIIANCPLLLL